MRCIRKIPRIHCGDMVINIEVYAGAKMPTLSEILRKRRLRWLGHVRRMNDSRLPKAALYSQLTQGSRKPGRPSLRFADAIKKDLRSFNILVDKIADDCGAWRIALLDGVIHHRTQWIENKTLR